MTPTPRPSPTTDPVPAERRHRRRRLIRGALTILLLGMPALPLSAVAQDAATPIPTSPIAVRTVEIGSDGTHVPQPPPAAVPVTGPVAPPNYRRIGGGGASVPESASGVELRLYQLDLAPDASFTLPESTGWTVGGVFGAVSFSPSSGFGFFGEPSILDAYSSAGGPVSGYAENTGAEPARLWAIGVFPAGVDLDATGPGLGFTAIARTALDGVAPGSRLNVQASFAASGPVARPIEPFVGSGLSASAAGGSVWRGFALGVLGESQVVDATGATVATVGEGQTLPLPDATGLAVVGPAQLPGDRLTSTLTLLVREQAPPVGLTGTPVAVPPSPVATPLATPVDPGTPGAVACDAEPPTPDETEVLIAALRVDPSAFTDPYGSHLRSLAGSGSPADAATVAAIQATLEEISVCGANRDTARALGLSSGQYAQILLVTTVTGQDELASVLTPLPVSAGIPSEFVLSGAEVFPDGRAGALVYTAGGAIYTTFTPDGSGGWLTDGIDATADLPGAMDATPAA